MILAPWPRISHVTSVLDSLAATTVVVRERRLTADAASVAFYSFNALVALVVFAYAAGTQSGAVNSLTVALQALTGVEVAELEALVERGGGNVSGRRRALVLGVAIATWSSLRLFRAVESVFAEVYETRAERSAIERFLDSAVVLVAVTMTLIGMVVAGSLFLFRATGVVWSALGPLVLWCAMTVLFLPVFAVFTRDSTVREVLPGTAFAAGGWTVSAIGLRVYVGLSRSVDLFGIAGAVLLVLTWLYVVGLAVVSGVVLNALLSGPLDTTETA
jgi:membrane protein